MWRSGLTILNIDANICYHHEQLMNKRYNLSHKTCSDPLKIHKKDVKGVYYGAYHSYTFLAKLYIQYFTIIIAILFSAMIERIHNIVDKVYGPCNNKKV